MITSLPVINDLNTYMDRFKKNEHDMKSLIDANRDRTDLLELPGTPTQFGDKAQQ